jgi:hypothetical protein
MRNAKLIGLTVAMLAIPASVSAQGMPFMSGGLSVFGGLAMPMGDFADDEGSDAGLATMGFALGADAHLPLGSSAFGWVTSVSINSLGFDSEDAFGEDADFGRYWLVPITTGVSYPIAMGPGMSLSPMAQIGLNIAYGPNGEDGDIEYETETSFSLAFSAGADFMFSQNLGATIRYMNGGGPEREIDAGDAGEGEFETSMTWLQLGVVYRMR